MSDHLPTLLVLNGLDAGKKIEHVTESRDLRPKNITALRNSIKNVNWDTLISSVIPFNDVGGSVIPHNVLVMNHLIDSMESY